jgi:hypothetical protein
VRSKAPETGKTKLNKNYTTLTQSPQTQKAPTAKQLETSKTKSKRRKGNGYKKH